jgi:hypothetical protein
MRIGDIMGIMEDRVNKIKEIRKNQARGLHDKLVAFVLNGEPGQTEIDKIQADNLQLLFTVAKKYKVRYLYVGKGEICGCEDKRDPGGTWPAMWSISREAGFPGSCGNSDQSQCPGSDIAFPEDSYGGWDLKENRRLTEDEEKKKKFHRVVTRDRSKDKDRW